VSKKMDARQRDKILDSIADGVFTVDGDWTITSFNRAAERITGVPREEAIGQKCFDVFRADICQESCALRKTLETGKEQINLRVTVLNHEGKSIPISISTAVLRDDRGEAIGGVETFRDLSTEEMLRKEIGGRYTFADIISKNHKMRGIFDVLPDIAQSESTVLIEGASGTGKELFARALHDLSRRGGKPFVAVNCAALPDTLLESELFGYVKGAFTDAKQDKPGRFALAAGGTIFLDEIGDVSTALQVKLLRVLQEREFEPLGSTGAVKADVRVIAATNSVLSDLVAEGRFRQDLFYRINVVRIILPPLSDRREDIPLLVDCFVHRFNASKGKEIDRVAPEVMAALMRHDFPGNIRELENIIEHAFVLCHGPEIHLEHLPPELVEKANSPKTTDADYVVNGSLREAEADAILDALRNHGGHRQRAAEELGIDVTTLWRKMKKFQIEFHSTRNG
jgi:PAS domain S-box-containing protein